MDRKNVLYIAVSLDGMIAREDGSIDWLDEFEGEGDNGYSDFYQTVDTVVLGRSTYEHVKVPNAGFSRIRIKHATFSQERPAAIRMNT